MSNPLQPIVDKINDLARRIRRLESAPAPVLHYVVVDNAVGDGVADDTAAIQAAIDATSAYGEVVLPPGEYGVSSPLLIDKTINFHGIGKPTIKVLSGSGAIKVVDTDYVIVSDLFIDLNNVADAIGVYHLGGWYAHYKDIFIDKSTSAASAYGFYVESTDAGDGSRGSFVEMFDNIVCNRVKLIGTATKQVTTCTFTNLDCEHVIMTNVLAATFIQPVIQSSGGGNILWDFTAVSGFTAIGGDYEGNGTVYNFNGVANNSIFCFGNEIASSFAGTYKAGFVSDTAYFMDFFPDSHYIEKLTSGMPFGIHGNMLLSAVTAPQYQTQNSGYTNKGRMGVHYDGDIIHYSNNLNLTDATHGNLDDTSKYGFNFSMGQTWARMQYASNGANPRSLTTMVYFEYNQVTFYSGPKIDGTGIFVPVLSAEPASKANGMIVYADGSSWNPGSGAGFYGYEAGAWVKL